MSNLLSQASLVMIPSGYKEDVVYSPVPTDGSGDLTFTRASNGTRVNSAGVVEVTPWNFFENSNLFTSWGSSGASVTITSGQTDPNGGTNAFLYTRTLAFDFIVSYINNDKYTVFCTVKKATSNFFRIAGISAGDAVFNVNTGVVASSSGSVTATIESLGNGWYKCIAYFDQNNGGFYLQNFPVANADNGSGSVYIYQAQANIGSTAKPYFPTTDRLNVPRLTYQNGGGGCPSLLLEKQSTNYITYSEDYTNAAWVKNGVSVTGNTTTSPDGTQNADKLTSNDPSGSVYRIYETNAIPSDSVCSVSCYFKYDNWQYAFIVGDNYSGVGKLAVFDLINATNTFVSSGYTATITNVGNGWYRCTMTGEMGITSYCQFGLAPTSTAYNNISIANGKNLYVWGIQREVSSYPTSYIPTTSSSATRVADVIGVKSLSSVGITSNYTLFFQLGECNLSASSSWILQGSSGSNTPFQIYGTTAILYTSTGYIYPFSFSSYNPNNSKVAVSYNGTNIKVFLDGVKIGQWTSTSEWANLNDLYLTYNPHQQLQYKQVVLFNVGLSDADGIALTTI